MEIDSFKQFEKFLASHVPPKEAVFKNDAGIKRMGYFMKLLGNPQNKIKVIHIAGTSGKGSTAYLTGHILWSQGFRVGLSVSPHILDIRERMQIFDLPRKSKPQARAKNTRCASNLPSKKLILKYFSEIQPTIKVMGKSKYGPPTFFEICIGLAYYIFAKEKLDYAVMETGLGGKIDATNCVSRRDKVAVITRIGHDHMSLLGNTISKIVNKKCGIIKNQNSVISIRQKAANIIKKKCEEKNSDLFLLDKKNYKIISANAQKTVFDFQFFPFSKKGIREAEKRENLKIKNLNLGLIGKHQAENCSLALACLCLLSKRDRFKINEKNLRKSLENINIPGRFNILKYYGKKVIIDGAHK